MSQSGDVKVLLVQTGGTDWDRAGRVAGASDLPLCEAGRAEVLAASAELQGTALSTIFCATDEASVCTARLVADVTGGKVRELDDLQEMHLGLWEGLRTCDLEDKCPTAYRQWMTDPTVVVVPEGETLDEAEARIIGGLAKALGKAKSNGAGIAVVLRPMALGLVRCWLEGVPTSELWSMLKGGARIEWRTVPRTLLKPSPLKSRIGLS